MSHAVRRKLFKLLRNVLSRFVKPSAMIYKAVTEVQYNLVYNQKDNKELIIGDSRQCFIDNAHQNGLHPEDVEEFFENVKTFFTAACVYMLKKMPLNDPVLQHIEVAGISQCLNGNTSSLHYFSFKCF
ncbi:hypothetical protein HHUSO_G23141 [Huso huso]|uniref:Uncharacterized protein n=1 Tax=Huso huso TaxID=61971 RepID=A0ABR0YVQ5_HUSHU